jgi:MFS family permease
MAAALGEVSTHRDCSGASSCCASAFGCMRPTPWSLPQLRFAALIYGGGCIIAALSPNMSALLTGRLAQGIGGGILLSLCYLAIQQWFAQSWWSRLFGVVAVIWGSGSLLGPLIGGVFAGLHAWRMTFAVFAIQAAMLWIMAGIWLPAHVPSRERPKAWPLPTLLVLSMATLLIAESSVAAGPGASLAECCSAPRCCMRRHDSIAVRVPGCSRCSYWICATPSVPDC